mgnify:FL=1
MKLTIRSPEKKQVDFVERVGVWHKKFIIWPRTVKSEKGMKQLAFLTTVYCKATLYLSTGNDYGHRLVPMYKYRFADDAVLEALQEGDKLEFDSQEAANHFQRLKERCND